MRVVIDWDNGWCSETCVLTDSKSLEGVSSWKGVSLFIERGFEYKSMEVLLPVKTYKILTSRQARYRENIADDWTVPGPWCVQFSIEIKRNVFFQWVWN